MTETLLLSPQPELVFGLVAPIGADLQIVAEVLEETLREVEYRTQEFRVTGLMREVPTGLSIAESPYIQSYKDRIAYANSMRAKLGDDALAALAVSAIRSFRAEEWERRGQSSSTKSHEKNELPNIVPSGRNLEEIPLPGQAYVVRQFKRPEEIALLRSVYARQFILVSAYVSQESRLERIEGLERQSHGGLISQVEAHKAAFDLVAQDAKETQDAHGQNVRDAFPLGDVFIDASSRTTCESTMRRFIHLLFGDNQITPTPMEYGMYMAKSASLRSSDLSRQVGAAIFRPSMEIIALGCNEVPKAGGGTYWSGDPLDSRDFVTGIDPNEQMKVELLVDVLDRLKKTQNLSATLMELGDTYAIAQSLLKSDDPNGLAESKVMDLLEFGRIIHAEMSAISDAARKGVPVEGATLFCTTFPCHLCAKDIVATGIKRVVFLEPYPKSYAFELHRDAINVEGDAEGRKVLFEAFIGVSPYRYRDLFEKGRRKYSGGIAQKWNKDVKRPMIEVYFPSYFEAETHVAASLHNALETLPKKRFASRKGGRRGPRGRGR